MKSKILIIGGGTGGHISPGIALYEEFKKNDITPFFLTGRRDKRFKYLSEIDDQNLYFYSAPAFTKNPFKLPIFFIKFLRAVLKIKKFIRKNNIGHVVGMGGYVSAPALLAAKFSKKKIWLCEQNVVPGKVTLMFAKHAHRIFTTFLETEDYVENDIVKKLICVGNPVRDIIFTDRTKKAAKDKYNLGHCKNIILCIGGSQGAVQLNELILNLKLNYSDQMRDVGVIWSTGAVSYEKYKMIIRENSKMGSVYLSSFIEDVGDAYKAADVAVSRSGSGVMMELAAMEVPSILVPYPYAADNHQSKNADAFVKQNASIKLEGKNISVEKLADAIFRILNNGQRMNSMKQGCRIAAKPDASQRIVKYIGESDAVS